MTIVECFDQIRKEEKPHSEDKPTCRDQNHSSEETHLLLTEAQVGELLAEVKHGVEEVPGTHGSQSVNAVFLPTQEGDGAVSYIKQRGEANHQHLPDTNTTQSV